MKTSRAPETAARPIRKRNSSGGMSAGRVSLGTAALAAAAVVLAGCGGGKSASEDALPTVLAAVSQTLSQNAVANMTLDDALVASADERAETLLVIDDALTRLAAVDARLARVVECRFFGGLTAAETAEALGITERTVERDWVKAKALLAHSLQR